jgi:hypothetical protein
MDMVFPLGSRRLPADRHPATLDFAVLTAALAAQRALGAGGRSPSSPSSRPAGEEALVELILAGPGWRQAASMQQGCFSRAEAGRRTNDL